MTFRFPRDYGSARRATVLAAALAACAAAPWMGCGGGDSTSQGGPTGSQGGSGSTTSSTSSSTTTGGQGGAAPCPTGQELCGDTCTITDFDPNNCGACGTVCDAGEVCSSGQCGVTCSGGTTLCDAACVDTDIDPAHCGDCATACQPGEVCSAGQCGVTCSGGTELCGGACVNTQNDPAHCGACNQPCLNGEVCSAGQCGLNCVGGTTQCGALCVDVNTDPAHCGDCATACPVGEVCSAGQCGLLCAGGTTQCGAVCVDVNTDPAHCGDCATACQPGQVCSAGVCSLACGGGSTQCGNLCVDTDTDPANCGGCGQPCGANEVCSGGTCSGICGGGLTKCGNNCVDLTNDAAHCGNCATVCPAGATCVASQCVQCNSATTDCDADGWLASEGDCCDKPGLCGAEPAKVNPGAIEVVGNGIDDNCNGQTDLFDSSDTVACDAGLASNSANAVDYAKAIGICRQTTENPPKAQKTWGLISAQLLRANGSALGDTRAKSIRPGFGTTIAPLDGQAIAVFSSGMAADATQTNPGPNGGAPAGGNVSTSHNPVSNVDLLAVGQQYSVHDWYATGNPPLKPANGLPDSPGCNASNVAAAQDSVMLVLRMRAPTNAKAFSFNSYFMSAEFPEYVCTSFNDQFIALVDTPSGTPTPIANPIDKNLLTYTANNQKWPIGINVAKGTNLFAVCNQAGACADPDVSAQSCSLGANGLAGTGFNTPAGQTCPIGGGTFWLTSAGNVIPGEIVELRIAIWDVGDSSYDSLALIDGFQWLSSATLPGTN